MTGSKRLAACVAAVVAMYACASQAMADAPRPLDQTLSYQLLQVEGSVRPVSKEKFTLLRSVLERATYAAVSKHSYPRSRRQAIEVLDAIQIALAEHNFLQPVSRRDYRDTLGDALEPLALSREERRLLLAPGEVNGFRARYVSPVRPLYFIDDDIGSQLFISVGHRMNWDIRLVQVDDHYFIRWYVSPGVLLNWDWTAGGPTRNEDYSIDEGRLYKTWPERRRYLKGLAAIYTRAHFLSLVARHAKATSGKRRVLELAMASDPTHEGVQNSLAWLYATDAGLGRSYGRLAVQYALSALAASPDDPNIIDTAACSYAAAGERGVAIELERSAIAKLRAEGRNRGIADYENRLRQIQNGGLCPASSPQ
jgi:hypothetical protein